MPRSGFITPRILASDQHGFRFVHKNFTSEAKLSPPDSGGLFTNRGAEDDILLTLPVSQNGMEFSFQVIASLHLGIRPDTEDAVFEIDTGDGFQAQPPGSVLCSNQPGSYVTLCSIGVDSYGRGRGWVVAKGIGGNWVVTSPDTSESAPEPVADTPKPVQEDVPSEQVTNKKRGRPRKNQEQGRAEHAQST